MQTLTQDQVTELDQAARNLHEVIKTAVQVLDGEDQARVIKGFNNGSAVIRQVTELHPGLMTTEFYVELADGEVITLGGSAF